VLSVDRLPKPPGWPAFGASAEGHRIRRLRRLSGVPVALEEIWLDGGRAARLDPRELSESLYLHYREAFGLAIARVEDRVSVAPAPDWAVAPFAPGTPCGFVERAAHAADESRVEVSRTWFDPERARYVARLP